MRRVGTTSWWLAGAGLLLAFALLLLAQPADVVALARRAHWAGLLAALAGTAALAALRGARLAILAGGKVRLARASAVAAVAQAATGVLPLRLGELAMIPLLQAAGLPGAIRAVSVLVLARVLDVVAVLLWATAGGAFVGGKPLLAVALLAAVAALLGAAWAALIAGVRRIAARWRGAGGWRRAALRQLLVVRREIAALARSPVRASAAVLASLATWAMIWAVTMVLLGAMGLDWPPLPVMAGVVGAALGSAVPITSVGSFGTQEAGWAAALAGVGISPRTALAAGFACHLWSIGFALVVGGVSLAYLAAARPEPASRPFLAALRNALRPDRRP